MFPLVIARGAIAAGVGGDAVVRGGGARKGEPSLAPDEPQRVLARFASNGWVGGWVNGIYPFHHFHAHSHEVLANLGDPIRVQFGGEAGPVVTFDTGSVALLPAGCGHCRLDQPASLVVVGAYPEGQEDWDLKRTGIDDCSAAIAAIAAVPRPRRDPLTGGAGPLLTYWLGGSPEPSS